MQKKKSSKPSKQAIKNKNVNFQTNPLPHIHYLWAMRIFFNTLLVEKKNFLNLNFSILHNQIIGIWIFLIINKFHSIHLFIAESNKQTNKQTK